MTSSRPLRIAYVTPRYRPVVGGIETHLGQLAQLLVRSHEVSRVEVWTHAVAGAPATEEQDGLVVRRFVAAGPERVATSRPLLHHVREHAHDVDVLHIQRYDTATAFAALVAPPDVPVVLTPHYPDTQHNLFATLVHPVFRIPGRRIVRRAEAVITVSTAEADAVRSHFPDVADRLHIIHNGVDPALATPRAPWPDQPPTIAVLGRLMTYKNIDVTLRAFAQSSSPGQLVVIGDGPDRARLESLRSSLRRASDIRILGALSDDEVARWLHTARAVVGMSSFEAFGLVLLEALASGAAVIASDIPPHREVRELGGGDRFTLVPSGDESALTTAVDAALTGERAAGRVVRSWDDMAREHLDVYRALRDGRSDADRTH